MIIFKENGSQTNCNPMANTFLAKRALSYFISLTPINAIFGVMTFKLFYDWLD